MPTVLNSLIANRIILCLGLVGALLLLDFTLRFLIRGLRINFQLRRLAQLVGKARGDVPGRIKQTLEAAFSGTCADKAWREFEETLHERAATVAGEREIVEIRATAPAGSFVSLDNVVDPRIQVEYFKHLPGILTGLGIIGTFTGLIQGLIAFNPAGDPSELRGSLAELFHHVMEAFTFSGIAIASAMLITLLEKALYSSCSNAIWRLGQQLDSLFRAGVGEEYLSSLVASSQDSAAQLRELKEAMVGELKELLTNLTFRQIQATQQLSADLGARIHDSLQEPLSAIALTVREAAGRQNEQAAAIMRQLMNSYTTQLRDIMGAQKGELGGVMGQAAATIAGAEVSLQALVQDLRQAGQQTSAGVQATISGLMRSLSEHQQQQGAVVTQATTAMIDELQRALIRIVAAQQDAEARSREASDSTLQAVNGHVAALSAENTRTMAATRDALDRMGEVSSGMIDRLSSGAIAVGAAVGSVHQAAESLGRVATEIATLQGQNREVAQAMTEASSQLAAGALGLGDVVKTLAEISGQLQSVAASAASEADARGALLKDLGEVMDSARIAGAEFGRLAGEVRETLTVGVEQFGNGIGKVLSTHLLDYQRQLGGAVDMLKGALEELAEYATRGEK